MTIRDEINRIFREFHRYTGDGKPNEPTGAQLPIGDPQSGVYSPKKSELRDAFGVIGDRLNDSVEKAEAARDAARDWAEAPEDAPIPGEPDGRSALHYAAKAAAAALIAEAVAGFDGTANTVVVNPPIGGESDVQSLLTRLLNNAPRTYISGLTLANNAVDAVNYIDIAAGEASSDDQNAADRRLIRLASGMTKRLDAAWATGNGNGGLDTGSKAATTAYGVWAILNPTTGVSDVIFTAASTPTMPSGFTKKRYLGSVQTAAGGALYTFTQIGDYFRRRTLSADIDTTTLGTTSVNTTMIALPGHSVLVDLNVRVLNTTQGVSVYIRHPSDTDSVPSFTGQPWGSISGPNNVSNISRVSVWSNSSRQIAARASAADTTLQASVLGWRDPRIFNPP
jgi:hypothetical protein